MTLMSLRDVVPRIGARTFGPFDLTLRAAERIAILGPSGAGKSTLIKLMAGEIAPLHGVIRLAGKPLAGWPRAALARRRAVLPQSCAVAFGLPVGWWSHSAG